MATICQKHGPSPRRSARGARSADRGRFASKLGGLTRYLGDPRLFAGAMYAILSRLFGPDPRRSGPAGGARFGPAAAAAADNWRSNTVPVDLGRALRSNIFRQLASDRGGSGRIGADRGGSAALSSISLSITGYLGTGSIRTNLEPRTLGLGPVGLSQGAGCGGRMCH